MAKVSNTRGWRAFNEQTEKERGGVNKAEGPTGGHVSPSDRPYVK
jgi:hypothetical protein